MILFVGLTSSRFTDKLSSNLTSFTRYNLMKGIFVRLYAVGAENGWEFSHDNGKFPTVFRGAE